MVISPHRTYSKKLSHIIQPFLREWTSKLKVLCKKDKTWKCVFYSSVKCEKVVSSASYVALFIYKIKFTAIWTLSSSNQLVSRMSPPNIFHIMYTYLRSVSHNIGRSSILVTHWTSKKKNKNNYSIIKYFFIQLGSSC